ncbi:MAG: nucleotide sugar dehydrogenase [bacterium]
MNVVVVGLGNVGIPLAASLAKRGHRVTGIDIDARKIHSIQAGRSPLATEEPDLNALLSQVVTAGTLTATESFDPCEDADAIFVCVETPIAASTQKPDYSSLEGALTDVAARMKRNVLISIESTLAPGTMRAVVRPLLEERSGLKVHEEFALVHCPERVTSGKLLYNLTHLDRVLGGDAPEDRARARDLYHEICSGELLESDWTSAELSKTIENAYRDVQLAFANEVALLCEEMGADAYAVRELVNSCPGRAMLRPGPGTGGHCLSKDSLLLASVAPNGVRLLTAARDVNERMLGHAGDLVRRALIQGEAELGESRIVLMGGAYKEDVAETSNSPGLALSRILEEGGAEVRLHDPLVPEQDGIVLWRDLEEAAKEADCLVLVTPHDAYRGLDWGTLGGAMRRRLVVDLRGVLDAEDLEGEGFQYVGLGRPAS